MSSCMIYGNARAAFLVAEKNGKAEFFVVTSSLGSNARQVGYLPNRVGSYDILTAPTICATRHA
jgi:hypothetical protein